MVRVCGLLGPYVVGQWFVLEAETGREHWSRRLRRPNTVRGVAHDVIIASEMRSDGPWTVVRSDYYSYRLAGDVIYVILGDAPESIPIDPAKPTFVKPNPADYEIGVIDIESGACRTFRLENAKQRKQCRVESVRGSRLLVSCDATVLTEYERW
jgi:hypothetical protein